MEQKYMSRAVLIETYWNVKLLKTLQRKHMEQKY